MPLFAFQHRGWIKKNYAFLCKVGTTAITERHVHSKLSWWSCSQRAFQRELNCITIVERYFSQNRTPCHTLKGDMSCFFEWKFQVHGQASAETNAGNTQTFTHKRIATKLTNSTSQGGFPVIFYAAF